MLEMIPREFWRTLYVELSAVDWDAVAAAEEREREQRRQELAARYDAAILAKQKAQRHKSNDNDRRREQIRIASKRHREKSKRLIK